MPEKVVQQYGELLESYIVDRNEEALYIGQQLSRQIIENNIAPEELISIHKTVLMELYPQMSEQFLSSYDFLIEMMIHYGLAHREHQSLIQKQEELAYEMDVAVRVQKMLVQPTCPSIEGLDVGWISEPAKKMSGDYLNLRSKNSNQLDVAVADVMGKGMPAALCMSMIKYGMDSLSEKNTEPHVVLEVVNRIVEKSMDNSMFISMFYGTYHADTAKFTYASAGHEPAIYYSAEKKQFEQLSAKGLLLGIQKDVHFEQKSVQLQKGDFIVMLTDGVTEVRTENGFIEEHVITTILESTKNESAKKITNNLYEELAKLQGYQLADDFTAVVLKKIS